MFNIIHNILDNRKRKELISRAGEDRSYIRFLYSSDFSIRAAILSLRTLMKSKCGNLAFELPRLPRRFAPRNDGLRVPHYSRTGRPPV